MKRKLSATAILAIAVLCITLTGAFAAVLNVAGILDFAGKLPNAYVPENAADAIIYENQRIETEHLVCTLQESFYDGKQLYLTALVEPKEPVLLVFGDESPLYPLRDLNPALEEGKTIGEYALEKYEGKIAKIAMEGETESSGRFMLNEDGSAVLYTEIRFQDEQPERVLSLCLSYIPMNDVTGFTATELESGNVQMYAFDAAEKTEIPLGLRAGELQTYTCNEILVFPEAGVQITKVIMNPTPLELRYELQYTVTDLEKYSAQEDGLWFEFIDPDSTAREYTEQRVSEGISGVCGISRLDGMVDEPVAAGTVFRQVGTIGLNAQSGRYTIRAYNCWDKKRYETVSFSVAAN